MTDRPTGDRTKADRPTDGQTGSQVASNPFQLKLEIFSKATLIISAECVDHSTLEREEKIVFYQQ